MNEALEFVLRSALIGIGGSAAIDLWATFLKRAFGVASLDYGLFGRWIGISQAGASHTTIFAKHGLFPVNRSLAGLRTLPDRDRLRGWGLGWARKLSIVPALIVGIATIVAPFFILQPRMGAGIAASRTPRPSIARLKSLGTHLAYALGLYLAALITATLVPIAG